MEGAKVKGGTIPPKIMVKTPGPDIVIVNENTTPAPETTPAAETTQPPVDGNNF